MRLNVVVDEAGKLPEMEAAAKRQSGVDVRFFQAPSDLNYVLPFPFVMYQAANKEIVREYGMEAEKLFYELVGGK